MFGKNPEMLARSKPIDIRHHFIREKIENKDFLVDYKPSDKMVADILTKGLPKLKHYKCLEILNLKNQGKMLKFYEIKKNYLNILFIKFSKKILG